MESSDLKDIFFIALQYIFGINLNKQMKRDDQLKISNPFANVI